MLKISVTPLFVMHAGEAAASSAAPPAPAAAEGGNGAGEPAKETIEVVFHSAEHSDVKLRVKPTAKLDRLIDAYCKKHQLDRTKYVFVFEGQRIKGEETCASLEMVTGSTVEVQQQQEGGYGCLLHL